MNRKIRFSFVCGFLSCLCVMMEAQLPLTDASSDLSILRSFKSSRHKRKLQQQSEYERLAAVLEEQSPDLQKSFIENAGKILLGVKLKAADKKALQTFLKTVAVDADLNPADKKSINHFFKRGLSTGAKIGIGVGSATAMAALVALVVAARSGTSRGMSGWLKARPDASIAHRGDSPVSLSTPRFLQAAGPVVLAGAEAGAGAGVGAGVGVDGSDRDAHMKRLLTHIQETYPISHRLFLYPSSFVFSFDSSFKPLSEFVEGIKDSAWLSNSQLILRLRLGEYRRNAVFECYVKTDGEGINMLDWRSGKVTKGLTCRGKLLQFLMQEANKELFVVSWDELQGFAQYLEQKGQSEWHDLQKLLRSKECYTEAVFSPAIGVSEIHGCRSAMEDAVAISWTEACKAVAVFDGHGGSGMAELCKKSLLSKLFGLGKKNRNDDDIKKAFYDFDLGCKEDISLFLGSGAACALVLVWDDMLKLVWAGDARGIIVDKSANVIKATVDHKPTNPEEASRIKRCGGSVDAGKVVVGSSSLSLSRAFGDYAGKSHSSRFKQRVGGKQLYEYIISNIPDIITVPSSELAAAHWLVLACDGLWDVMTNQEVARFVCAKSEEASYDIARALGLAAYERGSGDNISVVVINLEQMRKPTGAVVGAQAV